MDSLNLIMSLGIGGEKRGALSTTLQGNLARVAIERSCLAMLFSSELQ